jgi:hypothetical protein
MHHHPMGNFGGFGGPMLGGPMFGGFGMGLGSGLMGDLLAGGLGYYLGKRSTQGNQASFAPYQQYAQPSATNQSNNTLTQLKLLGQLRESGILTEEEFQEQKQRLLNGV